MIGTVGIYNSDFVQVLQGIDIIKAEVSETAKVFEHPLEDGTTVNDHKIINPVVIDLSGVISGSNYTNVYQEIKQAFKSETLLTVQTRTGSYPNMTIAKMPHSEDAGISDGVFISIEFKEAFLVKAQFGVFSMSDVSDPSQSSTVNRGEQLSSTPSQSSSDQGSFLYRQFIK